MPLYVKDPEVDRLAERLTALGGVSKTEAVRRALRRELEHLEGPSSLADRALKFSRELRKRAGPRAPQSVDKAFIDSLYETDDVR